jgi:hypothetical protein
VRPRFLLEVLCVALTTGCLTPAVLEKSRSRTDRQSFSTAIESVIGAERLETGALRVCLEMRTSPGKAKRAHVDVPLQWLASHRDRAVLDFGRDEGFETRIGNGQPSLRYVFFEEQLAPGCPETGASLPIHATSPPHAGSRADGIYTTQTDAGLRVRYRSSEPLWSSLSELELEPNLGDREVVNEIPGERVYYLALPFALAADVFLYLGYAMLLAI